MHTTNLKTLIESAAPVSPDRNYSLAWSWGGTIGIMTLKDGEQLLSFREERGAILRAGFSPDMRELLAENEDGSFSIWYTAGRLLGRDCDGAANIVDFMLANELVPCLNVSPDLKLSRFERTLRDFRYAQWDYFDWGNCACGTCALYKPAWNQALGRPELRCSLPLGCRYLNKSRLQKTAGAITARTSRPI